MTACAVFLNGCTSANGSVGKKRQPAHTDTKRSWKGVMTRPDLQRVEECCCSHVFRGAQIQDDVCQPLLRWSEDENMRQAAGMEVEWGV